MFENTFQKINDAVKPIVMAAATFGAYTGTSKEADAAILTSVSGQYNNSINLANTFIQNVDALPAAVQRIDPTNGTTHASAVMIAPDLFITAGHVTPRNDSTTASLTQIILGQNYNTSTERFPVLSTQRFPGYIFGDTSTIDLGIGRLSSFVPGMNTPVTFAPFSFGQTLTVIEYGNYGDITTGELPSVGDRLAGRAKTTSASGIYPSGTYYSTFFEGPGASDPLNVSTLNFASGSPWYDPSGNLAGLTIAGTNTFNGGYSTLLNLSDPAVQNWLQPQIQASWDRFNAVPEPSTLAVAAFGATCAGIATLLRSRRRQSEPPHEKWTLE